MAGESPRSLCPLSFWGGPLGRASGDCRSIYNGRMNSLLSPNAPYVPMGIAGLMFISFGLLGWLAWKSARSYETRHREAMTLYRRSIELSESGQRLQDETNSMMRELVSGTSRRASIARAVAGPRKTFKLTHDALIGRSACGT